MAAMKRKYLVSFTGILLALIFINLAGQFVFKRFDLTQDRRYTLSSTTLSIVEQVKEPLFIDVYLEGQFPADLRRLQEETRQLLEEFMAYNSNISFQFVNPLENQADQMQIAEQLYANGMKPISMTLNDKGKQSQEMVFPWAVATYGDRHAKIPLLKNIMGISTEDKVLSSVQHLEYAIADAVNTVIHEKTKKIAVIKGIGELEDVYMADFLKSVRENYYIAPFTLDSVAQNPNKTLQQLKEYDLAIIAKPTKSITEDKIQVLDQFVMNGGKTIWLIDQVQADMDSLTKTGGMLAYPKDFSLSELLFKYGVRVNPTLIMDEVATPIKLATGQQGSETTYQEYMWKFAPYALGNPGHPITKNIEGVKFDFANGIDTLKNNIRKTVLLRSSEYSKPLGTPLEIDLKKGIDKTPLESYQGKGNIPLAVLLEGTFTSAYKNRILPFKEPDYKDSGVANKMVVISDGDLIRNQLDQNGAPMELGYDKWTNNLFGNKEFLLNTVNYLLDDTGLIQLRTKDVKLALLDKEKVHNDYTQIQILIVVLPVAVIILFGWIFTFLRKKKYRR
ncbi:gliding motility-associated ABC transporter substrate-binding protein GldG [Myroides ceti]|uniref:Gliding motility-associated ABC transporter substrate-binding protein GldG n=1 Tax=Paenimyroides ceti TaxID=395087 RepID=A0ABT8CRG7_9FLAO|nr:gliding motility-associated ABC transporter substrate-binding protein GldG [Paenimyroides ceti]MDN3706268.1 gliding motility-associated ABC transporter substrate-binding protein GldG [Paenimyroides ceti]